jgi:hypothetical protein
MNIYSGNEIIMLTTDRLEQEMSPYSALMFAFRSAIAGTNIWGWPRNAIMSALNARYNMGNIHKWKA